MTINWCWNGGNCDAHDSDLSLQINEAIVTAHILVYPVICYALYVLSIRSTDLKHIGVNYTFLFYGFISVIVHTDFFIAHHMTSIWTETPGHTAFDHIGYVMIVASNCLLALGCGGYSMSCCKTNGKSHISRIASLFSVIIALCMVLATALLYPRCKSFAVGMTIVSAVWSVFSLKLVFVKGILVYIFIGMMAIILRGTLFGVMNLLCVQWLHIIIVFCFGIQYGAIAAAINNFEITDKRKATHDYYSVNGNV
eukprot:434188_1